MISWEANVGGSNHKCLFCYSQSENNPSKHLKTGQRGSKDLNNSAVGQWYSKYFIFSMQSYMIFV